MASLDGMTDCLAERVVKEEAYEPQMLPTPPSTHSSRSPSPTLEELADTPQEDAQTTTQKKKKKKKSKKSAKIKTADTALPPPPAPEDRPPVLCISRNKHWRYISSYHGPWLQLPLELLESLLVLNLDPATLTAPDSRFTSLSPASLSLPPSRQRDRGFASLGDHTPPDSPTFATLPPPPTFPYPKPGKASPPPIDPGVFRSVSTIRRLIDEASELSVRASSGLSAAALGSLRGSGNNAWATPQMLGLNPLGDNGGGGRSAPMSATRVHRLRALAVQKLAAAYKMDEIASSVMVMQGGSVFDDIAERVLRNDPHDPDARYVHFFHEKIPSSRHLAESTTTTVLDELIAIYPQRLEFFRTRGIVHCFRDEYALAVKDFTHVLREARAVRKAKHHHSGSQGNDKQRGKGHKKKGKGGGSRTNGQAPPSGTSAANGEQVTIDGPDGEPLLLHPSVLPGAPEPIEPQCLFLRAAAYLQHAVHLIEGAILGLEGIRKTPALDGAELRLCYVEGGRFGGVEIGNPDGPLGRRDGAKAQAYRDALAEDAFREQVTTLVKKAMRDHEKFLAYFDILDGAPNPAHGAPADLAQRTEYAYSLLESLRPAAHAANANAGSGKDSAGDALPEQPALYTTYHPLLVESHFSLLLCHLMVGDFAALLPAFARTAAVVDGLEGYPVFLPPRSMAQAEFMEVLERLAGGWANGALPHSLCRANSKLAAIEPPPRSPRAPPPPSPPADEDAGSGMSLGVNGSSSSSAVHASPAASGRESPESNDARAPNDMAEVIDCARILLAPVVARRRGRTEELALERKGKSKRPLNINVPLHGPRVEIVMAWMGAVHLYELDAACV